MPSTPDGQPSNARSGPGPGDTAGSESGDAAWPSIEPDLTRAPPPPAWKAIAKPPPLPTVGNPHQLKRGRYGSSAPIWQVSALGFEFVSYVVAAVAIGWGIDYFANSTPWGLLGGCLLGIAGGGYRLIRSYNAAMRRDK